MKQAPNPSIHREMSDNSEAQYTFHHLAANRISQDIP